MCGGIIGIMEVAVIVAGGFKAFPIQQDEHLLTCCAILSEIHCGQDW